MIRGEIAFFDLPFQGGHEQGGKRPAVIVSVEPSQSHNLLMVVPFTSQMEANRFPNTFTIQPTALNGLRSPSVALVFQLRAISKNRYKGKIGFLDPPSLSQLDLILRNMLGLSK